MAKPQDHEYLMKLIPDLSIFDYIEQQYSINQLGDLINFTIYSDLSKDEEFETEFYRAMFKSDKSITTNAPITYTFKNGNDYIIIAQSSDEPIKITATEDCNVIGVVF